MRALAAALILLLAVPAARADPRELERTWAAAVVWLPGRNAPVRASVEDLRGWLAWNPSPTAVVFAHGCDGIGRIGERIGRFLAEAGHLVVAPDSFARLDKPKSCEPARHRGGLHREVLGWRQDELRYALLRLRSFPSLASAPIAVVGHSEGAIAVATAKLPPVAARVVEGWTCHAAWPEYRGLAAPAEEPVLSLVGENDPWFDQPDLHGDCGEWMDSNDREPSLSGARLPPPSALAHLRWESAAPGSRVPRAGAETGSGVAGRQALKRAGNRQGGRPERAGVQTRRPSACRHLLTEIKAAATLGQPTSLGSPFSSASCRGFRPNPDLRLRPEAAPQRHRSRRSFVAQHEMPGAGRHCG